MSIIHDCSIQYLVFEGKHKGRICTVQRYFFANTNMDSVAHVVFADSVCGETATIMAKDLVAIDPPGWPLTEKEYERRLASSYDLEEYLERVEGIGSYLLRETCLTQPRVFKIADVLATGEIVENIRKGFEESALVYLDRTGWVELAPRLPIALQGNESFKLPAELSEYDVLATGCLISKRPIVVKDEWVNVFLDNNKHGIKVPFCIPLALA